MRLKIQPTAQPSSMRLANGVTDVTIRTSVFVAILLAGCGQNDGGRAECTEEPGGHRQAGSTMMLRAPVSSADGLEVIISDVYIPSGVQVPRHFHPGEEFLYVIEGSAVHVEEGKPDRVLSAGDAYVIPPEAVHAPYGGPDGGRAVVFRLHVAGKEERYLVPD